MPMTARVELGELKRRLGHGVEGIGNDNQDGVRRGATTLPTTSDMIL